MTEAIPETSRDLNDLFDRLRLAAIEAGLDPKTDDGLTGSVFKGGEASSNAALSPSDLPFECRALQFGRYTFVLTLLPDTPSWESVEDSVRRFRNQCVIARSFLGANQALDLQGILMAPRDTERDEDWRAIALMIERDDRVARKFVWLRPENPVSDDASFTELIRRSVLARPWVSDAQFTMAALDNISLLASEAQPKVSRDLIGDWIGLVQKEVDDPDGLVDELIKAFAKRQQI